MTRWAGAAASLLVLAALLWGSATPARACSGPGLENFIDNSEVIAEGWFTGWEVATDIPDSPGGGTPIRVHFAVSRTYKGPVSQGLTFVDAWSLTRRDGSDAWVAHTSCPNPFAGDPQGKAGIVGVLTNDFDGSKYPFVFFLGDSLSGEQYRQTVSTLVAALPAGGGAPGSAEGLSTATAALIAAGSVLLLVGIASFVFPAKGSRP